MRQLQWEKQVDSCHHAMGYVSQGEANIAAAAIQLFQPSTATEMSFRVK